MQSIDSAMGNLLSKLDVSQAKALRIAQNNQRFEQAVKRTWNDAPGTAIYVLAHVNGIYFKKDERPRKGSGRYDDRFLLGIYVDDSMAKSELNARREMLVLMLAQEGIRIDEIVLHSATWGMRERRLFPQALRDLQRMMNPACTEGDSRTADAPARRSGQSAACRGAAVEDQSRMLETLKRACCQALGDYEHAWLLLSQVEGAELLDSSKHARCRTVHARYLCNLYVERPEAFTAVFQNHKEAIMSKARELGLKLCDIRVLQSTPGMRGMQAFPRQGMPQPLRQQQLPADQGEQGR